MGRPTNQKLDELKHENKRLKRELNYMNRMYQQRTKEADLWKEFLNKMVEDLGNVERGGYENE
jgi:cell shape-determining protein MreC